RRQSLESQPVVHHAHVHVLQHVLRVFAPIIAARQCPAESLRMDRLNPGRQLLGANFHSRVSADADSGDECVESRGHMTFYDTVDLSEAKDLLRPPLYTTAPNSRPTSIVLAIATAPQTATRTAPLTIGAPPIRAATAPSASRSRRVVAMIAGT